jgi:hypothetical protein
MRKTLSTWVLVAGLIVSTNAFATASFANRSIGLGVSGFTILGDSTAVGIDWGVYGVPETFVIDGEGTVILRHAGPITASILQERIRPALVQAAGE